MQLKQLDYSSKTTHLFLFFYLGQFYKWKVSNNDMTLKIIKKITSEGTRRVLNIPKKYNEQCPVGKKMLIQDFEPEKMTKEELQELI